MKKGLLTFLFLFSVFTISFAQSIEKKWTLEKRENASGEVMKVKKGDYFQFEKGQFSYTINSEESLQGDYLQQHNILLLFPEVAEDSIIKYKVNTITDSTLVVSKKGISYLLTAQKDTATPVQVTQVDTLVPNQGFSFNSLWRGILGMIVLLIIAYLFSSNRKAINWKTVGLGVGFQVIIAIGVLKVPFVQTIFEWVGSLFVSVLDFTRAGSKFLFEGLVVDMDTFGFIFAFQVLPTIIFFSALTSLLFYLGVIQKVVKGLAWLLTKTLKISGAESLSVAGNIFLGQTEAPLLIKAYLEKMNKSEMLLVMVGGMATVAGAVLAAYIGFLGGDDPVLRLQFAKHLLAASVMAAPGAIVISKILFPQTEEINTDVHVSSEKIGSNILDAIANGTTEGLKLAVNVGAMLLVFVAFIAMLNGILSWVGDITSVNTWIASNTSYENLSLELILGYLFAPLMWLIGVAKEDIALMGQLLGIKLAASEFVGYIQLADLKNPANPLHLTYSKSVIMATYMLCGFANFASIGIQIGGIGSLAPGQRKTLSEFGMKALIGGTVASLLSATIAGMIIG
ncbi:NupC/NupG family nucleoside CNT transporter [Aquimarina mytili]|uniref:Na+ dependent nucleoside transporter n=1 Tax=Aquimarina mytili TaxID=874423 RepID=A0A937DAH0_9FLAO|nr:nucleoside transporter C-terminal domain-containing protein [Aquimarina mytili]MBL0683548.1 Na+ dependent nucleoside transporter [Aquimarina mytili]